MYAYLTLLYTAAALVLIPLALGFSFAMSLVLWREDRYYRPYCAFWAVMCLFGFVLKLKESLIGLPLVLQALRS